MQITANSLQDFNTKFISSQWNPPEKSNSFHPIKTIDSVGSINLYTDIKPRLNSNNFLITDKNELAYADNEIERYYCYYDIASKNYHKVIGDPDGEYTVLPTILSYPDNKDIIFVNAGKSNVYDILTHSGTVPAGVFNINGVGKYRSLTVITDTELLLDSSLTISDSIMKVYGYFNIGIDSVLNLENDSKLIIYPDAVLNIPENVSVNIDESSKIEIYGTVNISQNHMNKILDNPKIYIDTAAVLNVTDIPASDREYSLTDYESDLRNTLINIYNQGQHHSGIADIGYRWGGGTPVSKSQIIDMEVIYGNAILGDYKLSILGTQESIVPNRQFIRRLIIYRNAELNITESFYGGTYYSPELYLGTTLGNADTPGMCICNGSIIVDGENCKITIDRHAYFHIGEFGVVTLTNGARMISANNGNTIALEIDGTLIIDTLDQLQGFEPENIRFGENGKLVILNPDTGERNLLWTTPYNIKYSELYRLFVDDPEEYDEEKHELKHSRLRHIEYHIGANNGIGVDTRYENYHIYMNQWYNGMRLERAIKEGLIVWHSNAFIEFYQSVDERINVDCNLYDAARFFKHYGATKEEILQDVVNHFKYAGAGDIVFRFCETYPRYKEVTMTLDGISMLSTSHIPSGENAYNLKTDKDGMIFLKNRLSSIDAETIIQNDSLHQSLVAGDNTIAIE